MMLQLLDVHIIDREGPHCVQVQKGLLKSILSAPLDKQGLQLHFEDALVFPGLINSHDHLDFNLFPPLGDGPYDSYVQWGRDIHEKYKTAIKVVQQVPEKLRAQWGVYKNLCGGVTTVVNHGKKLRLPRAMPINVFQKCHSLHSVGFEQNWQRQLQRRFVKRQPVAIHCGEGTNESSLLEIDELVKANRFNRSLVGVHGVAMTAEQAAHFKAVVWCPVSNFFLLGKTAAVDVLAKHTRILFGTDATLTATWNIWEHLRLARQQGLLSDRSLLDAVMIDAAKVWGLDRLGSLAPGQKADLVVARANGRSGMDAFFAIDPVDILLVLHQGRVSLCDESVQLQLRQQGMDFGQYGQLIIGNRIKYVHGPVRQLIEQIKQYYPAVPFFPDTFNAIWADQPS